jgi:hypothetical protein
MGFTPTTLTAMGDLGETWRLIALSLNGGLSFTKALHVSQEDRGGLSIETTSDAAFS